MHIRFSVEIDTLTTEQRRGLSMLLTGIEVPSPYQVGPTPGKPEFEFKTEGTIKRSEVSLKAGDVVKTAMYPDEPLVVTERENRRIPTCTFWAGVSSFTKQGRFYPERASPEHDIIEVNGLKIIEDAP